MNILFYCSQKDREYAISEAFQKGVIRHGDKCRILPTADIEGIDSWADVACCLGVKGYSHLIMDSYLNAGKHFVYIDKGYLSGAKGPRSKYCRVSVDSFQPLEYFQAFPRPDDRFKALQINLKPTPHGKNIIIAGGSLKYAQWHSFNGRYGMDPMTTWAFDVINYVAEKSTHPIVYRPKPSWQDAQPLPGARFSRAPITIDDELANAYCLISYGSNAAVDAVIAGVPVVITGDGIVKPLSRNTLKYINDLYYPTDAERYQFLCDVAYQQWNLDELRSGLAWSYIKPQIEIYENQKKSTGEVKFFGDEH